MSTILEALEGSGVMLSKLAIPLGFAIGVPLLFHILDIAFALFRGRGGDGEGR